ncbi:hypothetical protein JW756_00895 [Candidatus Woesearchaeota archaeon]|nr:hypothetical protein [Candidatus Woesearchaeota archaeon]
MLITYLILLLIAFLGLFVGLLIGWLAKEELKPGMIFLDILRHVIFVAIIIIFFVKNWSILFVLLIAIILIFFSLSKYRETLFYYSLPIIFFLSWKYNGFAMIAPLIFLYGLPLGSIYLYRQLKEKKKNVVLRALYSYAGFLINGIILGLLGLFF